MVPKAVEWMRILFPKNFITLTLMREMVALMRNAWEEAEIFKIESRYERKMLQLEQASLESFRVKKFEGGNKQSKKKIWTDIQMSFGKLIH